jgi:hypothetical protein
MPCKSYIQHRLFEAVVHDKDVAKQRHIPVKVAEEFLAADKEAGIWQVKPTKSNPKGREKK